MVDKTMCRELKFTTYVKKIYKKVRVLFEMVVSCCSYDAIWIDEKKINFVFSQSYKRKIPNVLCTCTCFLDNVAFSLNIRFPLDDFGISSDEKQLERRCVFECSNLFAYEIFYCNCSLETDVILRPIDL